MYTKNHSSDCKVMKFYPRMIIGHPFNTVKVNIIYLLFPWLSAWSGSSASAVFSWHGIKASWNDL